MKTSLMIAAAAATLAFAAPQLAAAEPSLGATTVYGSLGYADTDASGHNAGSIQGRLGGRFGRYLGVEGELGFGVKSADTGVPGVDVKIRNQEAAYGVGFLPVTPHFDLLGRVGYGHTDFKASAPGVSLTGGDNSWNYGGGAQYFFDGANGLRADYTRESFNHGGDANVWALGYVRKF